MATDGPRQVVLNPAKPSEMVRTIQSLLGVRSSDQVRQVLAEQKVTINDLAMHGLADLNDITPGDVLDSPFFVIEGLSEVPHLEQDVEGRMSGDVSQTAGEVLTAFFSFDVHYEEWSSFATDTAYENNDDPPSKLRTDRYKTWGMLLFFLLNDTFESQVAKVGEIKELAVLERIFNGPLTSFGFRFVQNPGSAHDFEIQEFGEGGECIIFGEGKESGMLPRVCTEFGHELCLFGFATRVAKAQSPKTRTWTRRYANLRNLLGLRNGARKDVSQQASPLAEKLLRLEGNIQQVAASVLTRRRQGLFEEHDAVNLWAAVMQACHYTVPNRRRMTMVLSARVFWFIRLRNKAGKCSVEISGGHLFGERLFLRKLTQFLIQARDADEMANTELRLWETALGQEESDDEEADTTAGDPNDNPPADTGPNQKDESKELDGEEDYDEGQMTPCAKRVKRANDAAVPGNHHSTTQRLPYSCRSDSPPSLAEQNETGVDSLTPRRIDKYGVAVPWLYQIGKSFELLAKGRSGSVTKNMWAGEEVAVKTFILQEDDDRSFYDVYKHECKVLVALRSLWGTHIPRFMFRHPWKTSPMIGLQLGEPLGDDMSAWDPEDLKKAQETIAKVAALGWVQHDMRGRNFVRLRKGKDDWVAMIDFESVEKIAAPSQLVGL